MPSSDWGFSTTSDEVAAALSADIAGKNVLITGASPNGLGAEVVRVLAKYANLVILAGRSKEKLEKTIASVKVEAPDANLRILVLDLASADSVKKAASEVLAYKEPLHVLFNNAAISTNSYYTTDGIESQLYGNHVAHFLFTNLILPKLREAATPEYSPRIVTVSSEGHAFSPIHFDNINFTNAPSFKPMLGYAQSKTANILFTNVLAKRLASEGILAYSLHPGGIATELFNAGKPSLIEAGILNEDGTLKAEFGVLKTLQQGAATHIVAGFDPSIKAQSGGYLLDCHVHNEKIAPHASDPESAEKLWTWTEKTVGQSFL